MAEEKDFIDVTKKNPEKEALLEMNRVENEFTKAHKPYDRLGALNDFNDLKEDYAKKLGRAIQNKQELPAFPSKIDWKSYGDPKRFQLVAETKEFYTNARTGHVLPREMLLRTYLATSGHKVVVTVPVDQLAAENKNVKAV